MSTDLHSENFPPAPDGWSLQSHSGTFSSHAGPYYFRKEGGPAGVAFYSEQHHANGLGVVHGGALLTLADMALWDICRREVGIFKARVLVLENEVDLADRAVALFGDDQLGTARVFGVRRNSCSPDFRGVS